MDVALNMNMNVTCTMVCLMTDDSCFIVLAKLLTTSG